MLFMQQFFNKNAAFSLWILTMSIDLNTSWKSDLPNFLEKPQSS